jgi:hypothetical protein
LLILATSIIIVSSCGCLFYFFIKSIFGSKRDANDMNVIDPNNASRQSAPREDRFQQFNDEEHQPENQ